MENTETYQVIAVMLLIIFTGGISDTKSTTADPINCLDALTKCKNSPKCKKLMDALPRTCGKSLRVCNTNSVRHCRALINELQNTRIFDDCSCTKGHASFKECARINKTLTNHPCGDLSNTDPSKPKGPLIFPITRPPAITTKPTKASVVVHPPPGKGEGERGEDDHPKSCIGARKRCLQDNACKQALTRFRILCREKNQECIFVEPKGCASAVRLLRPFNLFACSCHMRKIKARKKCLRIQERVTNHTCIGSNTTEVNLEKPKHNDSSLDAVPSPRLLKSTCVSAFTNCNMDATCRIGMANYKEACQWIYHDERCLDRDHCLSRLAEFYEDVRPRYSHALLFCTCKPDDAKCEAIRKDLRPKCATYTFPQITCSDVMKQCTSSLTCKNKLSIYKESCKYEKNAGCVHPLARCRSAKVGIMGTILMTNCTCDGVPHASGQWKHCMAAHHLLMKTNICEELAHEQFVGAAIPSTTRKSVTGDVIRGGCREQLRERMPYMKIPSAVRFYFINDSECSEVCKCFDNGQLMCEVLPCIEARSCKVRNKNHAHGTEFYIAERGHCRCIKGEVICEKSSRIAVKSKTGIFLHIGYSKKERKEMESYLTFHTAILSSKLMKMNENKEGAKECEMHLHDYDNAAGNLIFKIQVAHNVSASLFRKARDNCQFKARLLSNMINTRKPSVTMDAQLSILKIAKVEIRRKPEKLPEESRPTEKEEEKEEKAPPYYIKRKPEVVYYNSLACGLQTSTSAITVSCIVIILTVFHQT